MIGWLPPVSVPCIFFCSSIALPAAYSRIVCRTHSCRTHTQVERIFAEDRAKLDKLRAVSQCRPPCCCQEQFFATPSFRHFRSARCYCCCCCSAVVLRLCLLPSVLPVARSLSHHFSFSLMDFSTAPLSIFSCWPTRTKKSTRSTAKSTRSRHEYVLCCRDSNLMPFLRDSHWCFYPLILTSSLLSLFFWSILNYTGGVDSVRATFRRALRIGTFVFVFRVSLLSLLAVILFSVATLHVHFEFVWFICFSNNALSCLACPSACSARPLARSPVPLICSPSRSLTRPLVLPDRSLAHPRCAGCRQAGGDAQVLRHVQHAGGQSQLHDQRGASSCCVI